MTDCDNKITDATGYKVGLAALSLNQRIGDWNVGEQKAQPNDHEDIDCHPRKWKNTIQSNQHSRSWCNNSGSAITKQVAELTYRHFFCAFKREGLLLPEPHSSFMVILDKEIK
jgi:hypothetical protein